MIALATVVSSVLWAQLGGPLVPKGPAAAPTTGPAIKLMQLDRKLALSELAPSSAERVLVVPDGWWSPARSWPGAVPLGLRGRGALVLVDGSVIIGRPATSTGDESIAWSHADLGTLTFKLDQVASVVLGSARPSLAPGKSDTVLLANGDALEGLVLSFTSDATGVTIERNNEKSTVPLERVREIRLSNPAQSPKGARLWLDDGTQVSCSSITPAADGAWLAKLDAREVTLSAARVRAACDDVSRLTGLGQLKLLDQQPGEGRRWWRPVELRTSALDLLGASDVVLPGPMSVRWAMPEGTKRLAGWVVLPEEARTWGDCELIVKADDRELARINLSAEKPESQLAADIPAGAKELRVELKPGPRGAVQSTLMLRKWLIVK